MSINVFEKDTEILNGYRNILNDYINWYSDQKEAQLKKEKEQQYQLITTILTEGLNKDLFTISIFPDTEPYIYKNHIFKSYILKNKTKSLILTILTTTHKEYGEPVYDTKLTLKSDSESIEIFYRSVLCVDIFKLITDYIFKNNLFQLLSTLEKQIYLFDYVAEKTKSKELIWTVASSKLKCVFQSKDHKYQFVYYNEQKEGEFIVDSDNEQLYKFHEKESVKLKKIIMESINCQVLDKILTNLNNNQNLLSITKQNSYAEN